MRAVFEFENPDEINATIKITMSMKEWKKLRDQLGKEWPSSRLYSAITEVMLETSVKCYAKNKGANEPKQLHNARRTQ